MFTCVLCRQPTELDDTVVMKPTRGLCICLRCYERETRSGKPLDHATAQQIIDAAGKD